MPLTAADALLTVALARQSGCAVDIAINRIRAEPDAAPVETTIQAGLRAMALARFWPAEDLFHRALRQQPGNGLAHMHLALLAGDLGARQRSLDHWLALAQQNPALPQPCFEAARLFSALGQHDRARAMLARLPEPVTDGFWLAEINDIQQARRHARAVLAEVAARQPAERSGSDIIALARALIGLGFARLGLRVLDTWPVSDAHQTDALVLRFESMRRQSLPDATAWLAAQLAPAHGPDGTLALAEALFECGQFQAASRLLGDVADRSFAMQALLFRIEFARRDATACTALAGQMIAMQPDQTAPYRFALAALFALEHAMVLSEPPPAEPGGIPPRVVQYWDQPEPPDDVRTIMQSWRLPPPWQTRLFDRRTAQAFIAAHHPPAVAHAFARCHHPAMRSDLFRLCYLVRCGGVYMDADEACADDGAALRQWLGGCDLAVPLLGGALPYANNALIGAAPEHPVLRAALDSATRRLCEWPDASPPPVWDVTGPGLLTRHLVRHLQAHGMAGLRLLSEAQWRQICRACNHLGYKQEAAGNWRMGATPETA